MQNQWFGAPRGAPVEKVLDHAETPVGKDCLFCLRPIREGDYGLMLVEEIDPDGVLGLRPTHLYCFRIALGIGPLSRR